MSLRFGRKSSSSSVSKGPPKSAWFDSLFDTFADADDGTIGPEGIEKLCSDLSLDPADVLVLVFAWQLEASHMGYFSREEWKRGAERGLACTTSFDDLRTTLSSLYTTARRTDAQLRSLHAFTHKFCREERRKNIDVSSAVAMLQLLHGEAFPNHVPKLTSFLEKHEAASKRGLSADEWAMILNFCTEIEPDCSNFQVRGHAEGNMLAPWHISCAQAPRHALARRRARGSPPDCRMTERGHSSSMTTWNGTERPTRSETLEGHPHVDAPSHWRLVRVYSSHGRRRPADAPARTRTVARRQPLPWIKLYSSQGYEPDTSWSTSRTLLCGYCAAYRLPHSVS